MVWEDSGLQKSMQIKEQRVRKQGPKKVCGIESKLSQNGAQIGTRNLQHFEKYWKNASQNRCKKKVPNADAQKTLGTDAQNPGF